MLELYSRQLLTDNKPMSITKTSFGSTRSGKAVDLYTLQNARGTSLSIMTYGGTITSLKTADKNGELADVVLGFDTLAEYEEKSPYFGAIIGRYANRIDSGKFTLDGKRYTLKQNDDTNHLHGGEQGFDRAVWNAKVDGDSLVLRYTSPDGEEGYPGQLTTRVTYTLSADDELHIDYGAQTDAPTIV